MNRSRFLTCSSWPACSIRWSRVRHLPQPQPELFWNWTPGSPKDQLEINSTFFLAFLGVQSMAGLLSWRRFTGPGLVRRTWETTPCRSTWRGPSRASSTWWAKLLRAAHAAFGDDVDPRAAAVRAAGYLEAAAGCGRTSARRGLFFGAWIWILVLPARPGALRVGEVEARRGR
jgi:hypothetical protein